MLGESYMAEEEKAAPVSANTGRDNGSWGRPKKQLQRGFTRSLSSSHSSSPVVNYRRKELNEDKLDDDYGEAQVIEAYLKNKWDLIHRGATF